MSTTSPYKRKPRLRVAIDRHEVGDVVNVGQTRWAIRDIEGKNVRLEAMNVSAGIIWRTTLDLLPDPVKVRR